MKFNWEDFKSGKIGVHCDTEDKAKDFVKECYEHGIKWEFSKENETHWKQYKEDTTYMCKDYMCRDGYYLYYGSMHAYDTPDYLNIVEYKEVNKVELKEGMIIECRNGNRYVLRKVYNELIASSNNEYMSVDYDEELNENKYFEIGFDVMKVYTSKAFILNDLFEDECLTCIWERKESKKMTLKQISEALGYEVEIVDNE